MQSFLKSIEENFADDETELKQMQLHQRLLVFHHQQNKLIVGKGGHTPPPPPPVHFLDQPPFF